MKRLAILCAMAMASACSWAQPSVSAIDPQFERLEQAVQWLNSQPWAGARRIQTRLLPMQEAGYRMYVASALAEEPSEVGSSALAAFYQGGATLNGSRSDVCFLLYNPSAKSALAQQFVDPYRRAHGDGMAPHLFLAAHELGHCLDFQARAQGGPKRQGASMEALADVFALRLLFASGTPPAQARAIVESRQRSGPTHATWAWVERALQTNLSSPSSFSIEDVWKKADQEVGRP